MESREKHCPGVNCGAGPGVESGHCGQVDTKYGTRPCPDVFHGGNKNFLRVSEHARSQQHFKPGSVQCCVYKSFFGAVLVNHSPVQPSAAETVLACFEVQAGDMAQRQNFSCMRSLWLYGGCRCCTVVFEGDSLPRAHPRDICNGLSFVVPIVCETWTSLRLNYAISMKIAYVCGCLCMLAGLGFYIYLEYDVYADQSYSVSHIVHMVICLIILNLAWLPWLLKYISNSGYNRTRTNGGNIQISQQVPTANCGANTQWKSSIILQTTKIIALFIFFFIFFFLDTDYHLRFDADVHSNFLDAWDFNNFISVTTWMNFILFLIRALANYVLVWGIGYMNLCRWSLVVPVLLSLPFCVVIFQVQELCSVQNDIDLFCSSKEFLENKEYIIVTTVILTLGQALVLARLMIKQQSRYMLAEKRLFWIPVSFSGTVDASLLLNCRDTISELESPCHVNWPSKIFICTTMYRENAQEMRNVLKSLAVVNICQRNTNTQRTLYNLSHSLRNV
ncbi:Chitin synthase 6 [Biomphalaria pfeifferi]|uniref:Chitin synthase 6 n=1 Tax=Biomphalaria pfeifferi TaxID=112525 RepID=A0AAD8C0Z3_BIOPF|nr:Chitin synthase 6 [Biomphalaria pfeifferi]